MNGDKKVIKLLSISTMLCAANSQRLASIGYIFACNEDWGLGHMAKKSREESIEEMNHADKLIAHILFLGGHPNLQKLDPLRIGQTPKETLECDLAAEHDAQAYYKEARKYCEEVGDYVTKNMFHV